MRPGLRQRQLLIALSCVAALALIAWIAIAGDSRPQVELTVTGYETNSLVDSESAINTYACALVRMSNTGTRMVKFEADMDSPTYTRFIPSTNGWVNASFGYCGLAVSEKTLAPGKSLKFRVLLLSDTPCRAEVQYRTSDFKLRLRRHMPTWLLARAPWFARESVATTPILRAAGDSVSKG